MVSFYLTICLIQLVCEAIRVTADSRTLIDNI